MELDTLIAFFLSLYIIQLSMLIFFRCLSSYMHKERLKIIKDISFSSLQRQTASTIIPQLRHFLTLATYCSCSKKDFQSYNRLSCDSSSPIGFWVTSSVFPLWIAINSNGVVELALMVSSCVLARPILSSFCLSCLFGVLSKRRNRQQSPGLLISKTASCWCVFRLNRLVITRRIEWRRR